MNRRDFFKLSPAFPAAAITASLVLRQDGKEPIELDVSVLKAQPGDVLVFSTPGPISAETSDRIKAYVESTHPRLKAIVMSEGLKIDGVLRTT